MFTLCMSCRLRYAAVVENPYFGLHVFTYNISMYLYAGIINRKAWWQTLWLKTSPDFFLGQDTPG